MEHYKNLSGNSQVESFELGGDSIKVRFRNGAEYLYDRGSTGSHHIIEMQRLARLGVGLNGYIDTYTKYGYAQQVK